MEPLCYVGAYQDWIAKSNRGYSHEAQYPYLDRDPNLRCMNKPTWKTGAKITRAITGELYSKAKF